MLAMKLLLLLATLSLATLSSAFVAPRPQCVGACTVGTSLFSTVIPGTETEKREKSDDLSIPPNEGEIRGPVEWLIDDLEVSREDGEPFHILLLDETFVQNERMTIEYAASSCVYVLAIPYDEAAELVAHAEAEGFSCLGTWGHGECVRLAGALQNRDLVCRVVPFCEGGDRAWQARKAEGDMKRAEDAGAGFN
ncbi:hypothetical protein ACHAXT_008288 [Thalassiosira profunda]